MRKSIMLGVVGVLLVASIAAAQAPALNLTVETDKALYMLGETVTYTVYAWTDPTGNEGVSLLSIGVADDQVETLGLPTTETLEPFPGFFLTGLAPSEYGLANGFSMESGGVLDADGEVVDITVRLGSTPPLKTGVGNGGQAVIFCQGSYVPDTVGIHTMVASMNAGNYWESADGPAMPFDAGVNTAGVYEVTDVIPEPATMALLGLGLSGLAVIRRRRA